MLIPYDALEVDTLTRLIEDFVTRDGTDNGDDTPLETRVLRVRQALTKGQALIVFDPESEQCQLMLKHDVPKHLFDRDSRIGHRHWMGVGLLPVATEDLLIDLRPVHIDSHRRFHTQLHLGAVHFQNAQSDLVTHRNYFTYRAA